MSRRKKTLYSSGVVLLSLFILLAFYALVQAAGSNLLSDPGFESYEGVSYDSWTEVGTAGGILKGTIAHGGTDSCRLNNPTTEYSARGIRSNAVSVTVGKKYDFGAWFYVDEEGVVSGTITQHDFRCRIEWRDSLNAVISLSPGTTGWSLSDWNVWEEKKLGNDVAAPTGAVTATLLIEGKEDLNVNHDLYIDDAYINSDNAPNAPWPNFPWWESGYKTKWFNDNTLLFEWAHSDFDGDGQQKYQVQVDDDSAFGSVNYDSGAVTSSNQYWTSGAISDGGYYYWRIKTWDTDSREGSWRTLADASSRFKVDATAPGSWANFASQKSDASWVGTASWNDDQTPDCQVQVTDATSGLKKAKWGYGDDANTVGHWALEPEEPNNPYHYDESGNQNHGTGSDVVWGEDCGFDAYQGFGNEAGSCQQFNGTSSYVEVSNSASLNPAAITVEVWAKSDVATWNESGFLVSKRNAYIMHPNSGTKNVNFYICDGNWYSASFTAPDGFDITQWHYYVATYDGLTIKIYVDGGAYTGSAEYSGSIDTTDTGSLYIGYDDGIAGRHFDGMIDEVRISNTARSAEDIALYYNNAAQYSYSTNEGGAWSAWAAAALAGSDGDTVATYITASSVPFNQDHATNNQVKFRVMDIAGNIGTSGAYTVKIDTTTPDIIGISCYTDNTKATPIAEDTWQTDGTVYFEWTDPTSLSDDTFYYEYNTTATNTITGDESTTATNSLDTFALTEGTYYLHVRPKNGAGAWGTERIFTIKYDNTAPVIDTVAVTSSDETYNYNPGLSATGGTTHFNSLTAEGAGQTLTITVTWTEANQTSFQGATAFGDSPPADTSETGGWTQAYTVEADAATQSGIVFTVTDVVGLTDTATITFTQDNVDPTLTGVACYADTPGDNAEYDNDTGVGLQWTESDGAGSGIGSVNAEVGDSLPDEPVGVGNQSDTDLGADGVSNTYYVQAIDNVGNASDVESDTIFIDTTTPDIVAVDAGPSSGDRTSLTSDTWFKSSDTGSDDQISFSWTDPASPSDDTFYYEYNNDSGDTISGDESNTTNPYIDNITINETDEYFHVKPKTAAGKWGIERKFIVKYDKTNPAVSADLIDEDPASDYLYVNGLIIYTNNSATTPGSFKITVTASDTEGSGIAQVSGELAFGDTPSDTGESPYYLTYSVEQGSTSDGTITITATDTAGNTNTVDVTHTNDIGAPTNVGCSSPADNAVGQSTSPTLTCLTAEDSGAGLHSTPYYFQLATDTGFSENVQNSADWQASNEWGPSTLSIGTDYYWHVKARDMVGNESAYGTTYKFTTSCAWIQTDWVGGTTALESGTWTIAYDKYYQGTNVDHTTADEVDLDGTATDGQLLLNPGFETGDIDNWEKLVVVSGTKHDSTIKYGGGWSCKFEDPTGVYTGRGIQSDEVDVIAGYGYSFKLWGYVAETAGVIGSTLIYSQIFWYQSDHSSNGNTTITAWRPASFGIWEQKTSGPHTAPANSAYARLNVRVRESTNNNNDIYIDDAEFIPPYGSTYQNGTLDSSVYDAGATGAVWGTITWTADTSPSGTSLTVKVRTDTNSNMSGATAWASCDAATSGNDITDLTGVTDGHRYIQYRVELATTDASHTPTFEEVTIEYVEGEGEETVTVTITNWRELY